MIKKIVEFRPSISSENIGDYIIQDYIDKTLEDIFESSIIVTMPTRSRLTEANYRHINNCDYAFVCGTNLIASNMHKRRQWDLSIRDGFKMHDVILLGVGWWQYQEKPDSYTKWLLKHILSNKYLHSVRDSYTEKMLRKAGIDNVVNTACPTMWELKSERISRIPKLKSKAVVTTLTNYMQNDDLDAFMLETLLGNYETVYVWLQAIEDYTQLQRLGVVDKVHIVPPTLKAYDEVLKSEVDYIGTRLHGGIRALNAGKRSLIIAVDNRAVEISKDTGLPVIRREDVRDMLDTKINEPSDINIVLPRENIIAWKSQFTRGGYVTYFACPFTLQRVG